MREFGFGDFFQSNSCGASSSHLNEMLWPLLEIRNLLTLKKESKKSISSSNYEYVENVSVS